MVCVKGVARVQQVGSYTSVNGRLFWSAGGVPVAMVISSPPDETVNCIVAQEPRAAKSFAAVCYFSGVVR